jgi:tRNA pseudouridine13 synthase
VDERVPILRACPEDFRVDEGLAYAPSGEGGHTYVHVEKRMLDTEDVVRILARAARVRPSEVGYAGRKDRRAITTQWLSVPGLDPDEARAVEAPGLRVLDAVCHPHKLRVGRVRSNRFDLVVRGVDAARVAAMHDAVAEIRDRGLPNRFGPQRFGRGGRNVERAIALARGEWRERDRRKARFLHSALQAHVFNAVLDARPLPIDEVELGDVAQVVASGGLFVVEDLERERPRSAAFEISATAPIFGPKAKAPGPPVAEREREVLRKLGLEDMPVPAGVRARGDRRPIRVPVPDLEATVEGDDVRLVFTLPSGSYATVLVGAVLGHVEESHERVEAGPPDSAPASE